MAGTTIVRPGTHERTIRWMKNEIQSLKNRLSQAGMGEIPGGAYEPALGSPLVDHYVLESTIAGVRAWVASGVGPDLTAIEALTGEGLAVRTAADTWALREIAVSGNGLNAVTNPKGIAGNPTLSLNIGTGAAQVAAGDHVHSGVYEPVIAAGTTAQYWRGDKSWATLNQAAVVGLTTADSPAFVTVKCSGLTDGYIPYHVSDATGLANSPIYTDGTNVGIGTASPAKKLHIKETIEYGVATHDTIKIETLHDGGTTTNPTSHGGLCWEFAGYDFGRIHVVQTNPSLAWTNRMAFCTMDGSGGTALERMAIDNSGSVLIGATAAVGTERFRVNGDVYSDGDVLLASGKVFKINGVQVVGARVIDARCDDAIDSGDATTDGVIDALRDAMIAHGLIAAA